MFNNRKRTFQTTDKQIPAEQPKAPLKTRKFFNTFFTTLLIYIFIAGLFLFNFNNLVNAFAKNKLLTIREALLQPQTSIPANQIFNSDPLQTSAGGSDSLLEVRKNVSFLIYSTLFKESDDGNMVSDIVKEFDFKESKELTIKIYDNIFWHDGKPLTANDVIFTLKQIEALGQDNIFYGAVNAGEITYKTVSNYELNIKLQKNDESPNAAYLQELIFPILPEHILYKYSQNDMRSLSGTEFGKNPIGSGPLVFSDNRGSELVLTKNTNYHKKSLNFDIYKFKLYKDIEDIKKDYILRNIDIFTRKDIAENDELNESLKDYSNINQSVLKNQRYVLYFNLNQGKSKSPFTNSYLLRNGLQKVINRSVLIDSISGYGRAVYGPIDQDSWAFHEDMKNAQALNINGFKKDVEDLGYTLKNGIYEKDKQKLTLRITYLHGDVRDKLTTTLKAELSKVGINVEFNEIGKETDSEEASTEIQVSNPAEQFNSIVNNRNFEVLLTIVSQYQDPDRFSEWHSTRINPPGLNLSSYNSIRSDFSLSQGRVEFDQELRKDHYKKFQFDFLQEIPAIYLLNPKMITFVNPKLSGFKKEIINDTQYKYMDIAEWKLMAVASNR